MTPGARLAVATGVVVLAASGAKGGGGGMEGGSPRTPEVGAALPDYAAPTLEGDTVSLQDYRGEAVLLNVWATWCPACRREMPSLQALHEELGPDGLRVIGVSIDGAGEETTIRDFLDEVGATYTILHDPQGRLLERAGFGLVGVPTTYLADRRGRLVERWIGEVDFAAAHIRAPVEETLFAGPPFRELRLVAEPGEVRAGPDGRWRTWHYSGQYPGPEIRVTEGERLRVTVENRLPDPTTVHWHGVPLPNAMDGVPGVTQPAIPPGESFVYDYVAEPAGTYMYHSHVGLQLDRGLVGPLIIEERTPHVSYDREYTLVLDDWLPDEPTPATDRADEGMGGMMDRMRGMMGREGGGMMLSDPARPEYRALLVNGRGLEDPPAFDAPSGERVRVEMLNRSPIHHPMHLHGHFFRVGDALKETVLVPGHMGRTSFEFTADNPGDWLFHCHNLYHLEGGMARVFQYV